MDARTCNDFQSDGVTLQVLEADHVAVLTLGNEKKRNALNHRLLAAIAKACDECIKQRIRALVLCARPCRGVWSAGHDIDELPIDGSDPLSSGNRLSAAIDALRGCPFPVIAMVNGSVWGGAFEMVASCDIVVADHQATFAMTPANLGLPYHTEGLLHFAERFPISRVKELFFTARTVDADEAHRLGIVNQVVSADELERYVLSMAKLIAQKAPLAIAAVKAQLNALSDTHVLSPDVIEHLGRLRRNAYESAEYRERVMAFRERRGPVHRE